MPFVCYIGWNLFRSGTIFLFDLVQEHYVTLKGHVAGSCCTCVRFHPANRNELILGNKNGELLLLEYDIRKRRGNKGYGKNGIVYIYLYLHAYIGVHVIVDIV